MYAIGERINGMFKSVAAAIKEHDPEPIQELARRQLKAGANALDVNVGPVAGDPLAAMEWLVKTIREVTDAPLAIDTTKPDVMSKGLETAGPGSIINSTNSSLMIASALERVPVALKPNRTPSRRRQSIALRARAWVPTPRRASVRAWPPSMLIIGMALPVAANRRAISASMSVPLV